MNLPRLILAVVLVATIHRAARAEPAALFVGGSVPTTDRDELTAIAREVAEASGWKVTIPAVDERTLAAVIECARGAAATECMPAQLDALDADRAIVLAIDREGKKGVNARATGWVFRRSGEQIAVDQRHCEPCDAPGLRDAVKELAGVLLRDARAAVSPSTIAVRSSPDGARVSIDGEFVGLTDLEHKVYAGPHTVVVEKPGYGTETRDVVTGDGEQTPVEVTLTPTNEPPVVTPKPRPLAPWFVVAGGAAVMVAGGLLLAVDEDAVSGDGGAVRVHRDSATLGVVGLGVGAAVTTVGIVWLWRTRRTEGRPAALVAPVFDLHGDTAVVGLSGRF